jgi:lysophospholipase L1-like esterase
MKIVTLGDSLTVGIQAESHPTHHDECTSYPRYLEILAEKRLGNRQSAVKVKVVNRGICGDLTSGMLSRFVRDVVMEKPNCVIILGGTNDIGWNMDPTMIVRNLGMMYDASQCKDIMPVACTVPSILGYDELISPRLRLNRMIRTKAEKRRIAFVDLFAATADLQTNRLLVQYSADGLHLNGEGYRRVGQYIFDKWLSELLEKYAE